MVGKPAVGSVVGPTTLTHWGQVLTLPHVYGVVEVSFPDGGARAKGVHILTELSRRLDTQPVSLKELQEIASELVEEGVETVLLCVPVGRVVYIALSGKGDVYLKRGNEFARLLHDNGSISGELKSGDTLLLASSEFSRALTSQEAAHMFDHQTPTEIAEKLTILLHEKPYGEGSAAVILQFGEVSQESIAVTASKLAQARVFLAHFHPRRVKRHMSISVLKDDIARLKRNPKKATLFFTILFIVLFGSAVVVGIWKQSLSGASPAVKATMSDARHALDEGVALLPLNPVKGRERLTTAKGLLEPLTKTVSSRSQTGRELADMLQEIEDNLTQSLQVTKIEPELFFDGSLVKKGATLTAMGFDTSYMGLLDTGTQTVLALDAKSKEATILGGGSSFPGMSFIAVHGDQYFVLTQNGIVQVLLSDTTKRSKVVSKDPQWGTITAMVSYGGNLYLLDTTHSRIWKYVSTETGFTDTREYLNPDTLPDLTQTNSLAIDGSVWLGSKNGRIWKFTGGKEDTFIPQGVTPAFGNNLVIYTDDTSNNLYILDVTNKRVVVLEKDGTYLAQYVWTKELAPTQLAVSEEAHMIYLLAGGKLYTIPLK